MRKKFLISLLCFTFLIAASIPTYATETNPSTQESHITISPRADVIKWRVKEINDRMYRRLYNYTKQVWIGNWIPM